MRLFDELQAAGFALKADNGRLLVAPVSRLTTGQRERIGAQRDELLAALAARKKELLPAARLHAQVEARQPRIREYLRGLSPEEITALQDEIDERRAILEYDGGCEREAADYWAEPLTLLARLGIAPEFF